MRIVLFLGAGFSAPFGLPVMNSFVEFAHNSKNISDDDKKLIDELLLDARNANSFLESRPTNLEDILSFAVMRDRVGLMMPNSVERMPRIKKIIQSIYSQPANPDDYWEKFDHLRKFLGFDLHESDHQLSIITTNYDLNIESALHRSGRSANPGFEFQQIEDGQYNVHGNLYSLNGLPLFKLHGSVNWYEDIKNDGSFRVEGRVVSVIGGIKKITNILPLVCVSNYKNDDIPIIIPPSFLKPDFSGPMRQIWTSAAKSLETAEIVAFIGYSFPPTDTEMRYFLAGPFVNNARLRKIYIVDTRAKQISERLKANNSGYGSHFKELLEPIEDNWINASINI